VWRNECRINERPSPEVTLAEVDPESDPVIVRA
jgi:hypothetical protein